MGDSRTWYTTRERVKSAVDVKDSARANAQIDRLIGAGARNVDRLCHRAFDPWTGTRTFDWADLSSPTPRRFWLTGQRDLVSLTSATSGGLDLDIAGLLLYPDEGPPYDRIETSDATSAGFDSGATDQYSLAMLGVWGYDLIEDAVGALAEDLDASETAVDVANEAAIGVGSVLRVDSERMVVTEKSALDTAVDLAGNLTAELKNNTVPLSTTVNAPATGEMIIIDAERMRVNEVIGTNAFVTRGYDGTILAAHTSGANIYAYRTLTVQRGALGTTAATHTNGATLNRWIPPDPVEALNVAETLVLLAQENSAYARVIGQGENQREARGAGLAQLRRDVYGAYGKLGRTGAV